MLLGDFLKILELHHFEKVHGSVCAVIVLPQNSEICPMDTEDNLKKTLATLLRGKKGEYPFLIISLAPLAYGKVLKKRGSRKPSS
ncbi:hypothetical protein ES704_03876 [subsurface metagenome]|jgi:hypothetical protein